MDKVTPELASANLTSSYDKGRHQEKNLKQLHNGAILPQL